MTFGRGEPGAFAPGGTCGGTVAARSELAAVRAARAKVSRRRVMSVSPRPRLRLWSHPAGEVAHAARAVLSTTFPGAGEEVPGQRASARKKTGRAPLPIIGGAGPGQSG